MVSAVSWLGQLRSGQVRSVQYLGDTKKMKKVAHSFLRSRSASSISGHVYSIDLLTCHL